MRHYVTHDGGAQDVYHVPTDADARASLVSGTPTVMVVDLRRHEDDVERVIVPSANATVDDLDVGLSAAAGATAADPYRIPVDDTTGILEGHRYLLSEGDRTEVVLVAGVDAAANTVSTRDEIRQSWTASASLLGLELSAEFPAAEADLDEALEDGGGPYGVVWTYTIDGRVYHPIDDLYIRRWTTQALCSVDDVVAAAPRLASRLRSDGGLIEKAAAFASRHCRSEIELAREKPENLHSEPLSLAVTYRAAALALRWIRPEGGDADEADAAEYDRQYQSLMRSMLNGAPGERTTQIKTLDAAATPGGTKFSLNELFEPT